MRYDVLQRWCTAMVLLPMLLALVGCTGSTSSEPPSPSASSLSVDLPEYYLSGMVLQRNKPIRLHGTVQGTSTSKSVQVMARLTYKDKQYESSTQAGIDKQFNITIDKVPSQADAYILTFLLEGQVKRTIHNVYVGDVFIAAGQSNMELNYADYYEQPDSFDSNVRYMCTKSDLHIFVEDDNIRFLVVDHKIGSSALPLKYFNSAQWLPANESNAKKLGYLPQLFAEQLRLHHPNIPIGIIQTAWGGTDIARHLRDGDIYANHIAPLDGYNVAGILWYQGENDAAEQEPALQYEANFSTLINQYREVLGDSDLPFLYVQLARYTGYAYTPIVRQAQFSVLHSAAVNTTRNLAMTVSMDTDKGTAKIIHPLGKEILAKRMADQWLAIEGQTTIPSGPQASSAEPVDGDASTVSVSFNTGTAHGLQALEPNRTLRATTSTLTSSTDLPLQGFEVAGIDGVFHTASAYIQGNTVRLHSDEVSAVSQVRYLWGGAPTSQSMLYNAQKLPASPFLIAVRNTPILYRNR